MRALSKILLALALISIGILIGAYLCNFTYFTFDKNISIGDMFGLSVSSVIGLYIAITIQNVQSVSRSEKDFLIGEVVSIKSDIQKIKNQNETGTFTFNATKLQFKSINHSLLSLKELLEASQSCKSINIDKLNREFRRLRNGVLSISPVNDIIYTAGVRPAIEMSVNTILSELYQLIMKINRA